MKTMVYTNVGFDFIRVVLFLFFRFYRNQQYYKTAKTAQRWYPCIAIGYYMLLNTVVIK